jgi:hypothetical protein
MFTIEEHLRDLTGHLSHVQDSTLLLGTRLIEIGRKDFGRLLIARGHTHDASKFHGIEWKYLHVGQDVDPDRLKDAIDQHVHTNSHHPEFHGGIHNMPELDVAEMVCDCHGRSKEFGKDLRKWFTDEAVTKYNIDLKSIQWGWIQDSLKLLLRSSFR